ncbi:hypothetical protein MDAP_001176 [Mitosporidium daphniae]|uniref:Uracil-DNA glycosylase n=1 Tax=Mitosporidium daphniae TaxID=1485682 RepID=A0A098VU38_9MICR|nr:uracil-DNA glycosylase [Mitosporidium daphniae]KGG52477.1 uracil-DNA glycosylase [Mitosporidium daphniae]|eukprot:XP_013238904.1 uracil-DNA glycosylase [Mitosporidium daphniae]
MPTLYQHYSKVQTEQPSAIGHVAHQSAVNRLILGVEASWRDILGDEFKKPYFMKLAQQLETERAKFTVYPPESQTFRWSQLTPFGSVRVVIIGQDPYHGEGQATGLAFSLAKGRPPQPSLRNIFKEVNACIATKMVFPHASLEYWATQGVLLLNTTLTVRANTPNSHAQFGWDIFTDKVIELVALHAPKRVAFMLWGVHARRKESLIRRCDGGNRHLILTASHPVSFTATRDFLGCGHFRLANEFLLAQHESPIDWAVEPGNNKHEEI